MVLRYGGGCATCHGWMDKGEEAYYIDGQLFHPKCLNEPKPFEDEVLDRLADLADRCHRIEDKLVSLCVPIPEKQLKVEDLMGGKK